MRSEIIPVGVLVACSAAQAQPLVHVVVDMDAHTPGIQQTVRVGPETNVVEGVAVYIYAVSGKPSFRTIGYLGGIDRGIAFGHEPVSGNRGSVVAFDDHPGTPANPGNHIEMLSVGRCCMQRWFDGPEVQYLEFNVGTPAVIKTWPTPPIFTVDIRLSDHHVGDVFSFYVFDTVAANFGEYGAFTASDLRSLDTGGDAVPDRTATHTSIDLDNPVPVPPGAFVVDFIDGPVAGGGATIEVVCTADYDGNGVVNSRDFFIFLRDFFASDPQADLNRDGWIDSQDVLDYLTAFFLGCG